MDDAELEAQAQAMAEKALAALPEAAKAAKIGKVKEGILKRLQAQRGGAADAGAAVAAAGASAGGAGAAGAAAPAAAAPEPPPPPPPPEEEKPGEKPKVELKGVESCGDDPWFADLAVRRALHDSVVAGHAEQKILVGAPADEIRRICPGGGRVLMAGAVLRLGGATLGGYGEQDIGYAYRQLSRALHPDKNPDVPEAPDAFKRLREASDELKAGLTEARAVLQAFCVVMGTAAMPDMLERPQEALFAEANRVLAAVLALSGQGEVPPTALHRGMVAFDKAPCFATCTSQLLNAEWWDASRLLDHFAHAQVRTAYDCAPKRFRAQFITALNRCILAEAKRNSECVRGNWQAVMTVFPEIHMWRDFRERLVQKVTTPDEGDAEENGKAANDDDNKRSKWDEKEQTQPDELSKWAKNWREKIKMVLPRGTEEALAVTDPEVLRLCVAIWREIAEWARADPSLARCLELFTADTGGRVYIQPGIEVGEGPAEWAFVPATDVLLVLGEGLVGITAEGAFAENTAGHEKCTFEEAMSGKPRKKRSSSRDRRRRDRSKSGGNEKGDKEKPKNDPDFDWEKVWRSRVRSRRATAYSPPPRRSRSRRRRRRGGGSRSRSRSEQPRERRRRKARSISS
eukprot:TRINITY_DN10616_c0_g5_i1.p2 TRINITY_DN10616_c0_g5~~TRINITY_DN10616_c0_g5_i1.p2  ORF type:complete len:629 (-),score=151.92 TRINITY_DN10616_c0_g5_i1:93-1979(-)